MNEFNKFSLLDFSLSAEEIGSITSKTISNSRDFLKKILSSSINTTFENTIAPFSEQEGILFLTYKNIYILNAVSASDDVRKASRESQTIFQNYFIELKTRKDLYDIFVDIRKNESQTLEVTDLRYLDKKLSEFERNGMKIEDENDRKKVIDIQNKISTNNSQFQKNIVDYQTKKHFYFTKKELEGCDDEFLEKRKKDDDKYELSLKYPDKMNILKFCKVENTRKIIFEESNSQCREENNLLLNQNIKLRNELALLLGYTEKNNLSDYPQYRLDIRMAKTKKNLISFLDEIEEKVTPVYLRDREDYEKLKKKDNNNNELKIHDLYYYSRIFKEEKFKLDYQKIRKFYPQEQTISKIIDFFQDFLDLDIQLVENNYNNNNNNQEKNKMFWNSEIMLYLVRDRRTKDVISFFYLDLYPRNNKYQHFCVIELQPTFMKSKEQKRVLPIPIMLGNFGRTGGFSHDELKTFFHEFGHLFHIVCSRSKYAIFSGYETVFDFLELPSMSFEKFGFQEKILRRISSEAVIDESTNQKGIIPLDICSRISKSIECNRAFFVLCIIYRSKFDIMSYGIVRDGQASLQDFYNQCASKTLKVAVNPETCGHTSFHHLMHPVWEYDVGYYSYLWAEVLSWDVYFKFLNKDNNCLNFNEGKRFRDLVLRFGGEKDAMKLLEDFLGRKTNNESFLKSVK